MVSRVDGQHEILAREILDLGLCISVGKGMVYQPVDNTNNVVDYFGSKDSSMEPYAVFYVARDQDYAEQLRLADESGDDSHFGRMLDYPECCVRKVEIAGRVPSVLEAYGNLSSDGEYHIWTWPIAMIGDAAMLVHYPCSSSCEPSIQMAKKHYAILATHGSEALICRVKLHHEAFYSISEDRIYIHEEQGELAPKGELHGFEEITV